MRLPPHLYSLLVAFDKLWHALCDFTGGISTFSSYCLNSMDILGHRKIGIPGKPITLAMFTDLHQWPKGINHFEARGRIIDFEKEGYSSEKNVELIQVITARVKPDLVIFTGDIIDSRPLEDGPEDGYLDVMRAVIEPLLYHKIPWTFVPGNHDHDSDAAPFKHSDLLRIYELPLCISRGASNFNHTLTVGPTDASDPESSLRLWLLDSGINHPDPKIRYTTFAPEAVQEMKNFIEKNLIEKTSLEICFFHIPLPEFDGLVPIIGTNGLFDAALCANKVPFPWSCAPWLVKKLGYQNVTGCSRLNSGIFEQVIAKHRNIIGCFVGHDHYCDAIYLKEGVYLGYGRCGSFTPPSDWEKAGGPLQFERGARIFQGILSDSTTTDKKHVLETWVEIFSGEDPNSRLKMTRR